MRPRPLLGVMLLVGGVLIFLAALATGPFDVARAALAAVGVAIAATGMLDIDRGARTPSRR